MTAHSQDTAEAADVRSSEMTDDAAAASFNKIFSDEGEEPDDGDDEPETDPEADEVDEADDGETDDDDGEPDTPAIPAPVSLTADEKARYAQLSPEAQQLLSEVEARRNRDVQQVTTKAAEAQRAAEAAAANAQMEAQRASVEKYRNFVTAYAPAPPDPNLAYSNPQHYIALKAQYDAEKAQHDTIVQQIDALQAQTEKHFEAQQQEWARQQHAEMLKIPEIADPNQRGPFLEAMSAIGAELGFTPEAMADATANEILALKRASEWKAKAEKYDAAQGRKMQRVRDAKSAKPNPAKPIGDGRARALSDAQDRLRKTGSDADAVAAFAAMGF